MSKRHPYNEASYELSSKLLKGGYIRDYTGGYYGVIKGDTRSSDYSSYVTFYCQSKVCHESFSDKHLSFTRTSVVS